MALRIENISFEYKRLNDTPFKALDDISFELESGSICAIMGETGSGKSTLMRLLNGLREPSSGRILFHGEDIWGKDYDRHSLPFRIGLVFQYPEAQLFEETVIKDVCFGPLNMGKSKGEAEEMAKRALSLVGLEENKWNVSPFSLSGGEKRRASLAGVIAMDPEILVLDEIAAGLDQEGHDKIFALLKRLNQEGKTIVFVSHSPDDAAEYAEKVIVLERGRKKAEGSVRDIFSLPNIPMPQSELIARGLREKGLPLPSPILSLDELSQEIGKVI